MWNKKKPYSWGGQLVPCRVPQKPEYILYNSVGPYPNTALFDPPQKIFFSCQGSDLSSLLGRKINSEKTRFDDVQCFFLFLPKWWQILPTGCSMSFEGLPCPVDRSWCARSAAALILRVASATELMLRAALLRRSCDGVAAATELRRSAPSRSFCASRLDATR